VTLAPEQAAVLETDPTRARDIGRKHLHRYLRLPNYTNNFLRLGFTAEDLEDGGSDRLVDGMVAWGDEAAIAARVRSHRDAGADHVCLQVLPRAGETMPTDQWRALAAALTVA
jgi:probable F420-dependent oxidoreductase